MTPDITIMINEDISNMPHDVYEGGPGVTWVTVVFRPLDILC